VVIPWVALKMALLPKTLVWAKTAHGAGGVQQEEEFEDADVAAIEVATESGGG
jgi:1,2-diacylglycerol 3-beta-glucosyltransferase